MVLLITIVAAILGAVIILANLGFFIRLVLVGACGAVALGALIVINVLFFGG